jgi:signal transduction histidine kinase
MPKHQTEEDRLLALTYDILDAWGQRGDGAPERFLAYFTDDITGFGSGLDEMAANLVELESFVRREHEEVPIPITIRLIWGRARLLNPSIGLVEGELEVTVPVAEAEILTFEGRCTFVFRRDGDHWLATHWHVSRPALDQAEGESFPVDALRARNKELERLVAERTAELKQSLFNLKTTQQQLVQSEKMASLGALTAGIAHEIKNPLNFINNFSSLSKELVEELREALEAGDTDEVESGLAHLTMNAAKIEEHGRRADRIVRSMMEHARGDSGARETVDLNELVDKYVHLAYHGTRARLPDFDAEIERDLGDAVGQVELVPQEIGRVILNLIANAVDAVHEQATRVRGAHAPRIMVGTRRLGEQVEIRVVDNGPGIPEKVRTRIFEPFFTTKPTGSGTGLGLSLAYDIITMGHGGRLTVESDDGRGATFIIELPANKPDSIRALGHDA